jgi:valyl-tRNA synthetase
MTRVSDPNEMRGAYDPAAAESKWYQFWLERNYFKAQIVPGKKPFTVIMPPPNVTGELHVGHALTAAIEDILVRWHRMQGDPTLWLPGIDHAGIAAQVVVEQALAREGTDRHALGREKFEERMRAWAVSCRHNIGQQHQRLGISCDWDRETFTLDPGPCRAVRTTFVNLYNKGLIYRGERIINWCTRCATAVSDLEVDHKELTGNLYHIHYYLADGSGDYLTVATTRPETLLGDTAVAVNPNDERYGKLVGQNVVLPVVGREIPIIADEAVETEFGTGAVKITPAHDPVDFDVSQRHNLPIINVINPDATMNEAAGPYFGMGVYECRERLLADLDKDGLLEKVEPYNHKVGHCQRCQTVIEPLVSKQWFVHAEPLAKPAIEAVKDGRITIIPERFSRVYLKWMENIRDWCISRQLWWGHRIPVWYCADCGEVIVPMEDPVTCPKCGSGKLEQDSDMLDTWFSSGLWPHSTLGWPDETEDLKYFYPTSVMETGYDIIFFWVARMIMMGIENTGQIPFDTVYLHGLVRDSKGEKMSKVKGNVINPLETIGEYGTDALRFALSTGTSPGNDMKLTSQKLEMARNFANKLWNAARFVIGTIEADGNYGVTGGDLPVEDRWILSRLNRTVADVAGMLKEYQFGEAQRHIYDFLWGEYCDWYIEMAKIRLGKPEMVSPLPVLVRVLEVSLRLLHPFMPFITEELWQALKARCRGVSGLDGEWDTESVMVAVYPVAEDAAGDDSAEELMNAFIEVVRALRNTRAEYRVEAGHWIEAQVCSKKLSRELAALKPAIEVLARARPLTFSALSPEAGQGSVVTVLTASEVVVPLSSMVDAETERKRLDGEIENLRGEVARLEKMMTDDAFLSKAPEAVVAKQRDNLTQRRDRLMRLVEQRQNLG